ncbi:hypothetical protein KEM60_00156 [Austwickia sp. TVS 96-490-7B]|uniref:dihydrolipoamide acetyltransferase family protein n=1 Tax=Austwickia sp. TVS 96-490-7B TaxID=2830843 RepID=UPI001C593305|nr:dihydrolipoamide acetyltransferase family protein [Austwickia sp. TVS 96-490-7B]MBW3083973.1 hypothetical protein [Austwickia sp. TVS 96-490-7B]
MSTQTFLLPDLGEGLTEAEIVSWAVETGDTVAVDQVIVTVETAKAQVEVPCPYAGVVTDRHGRAGEVLDVGAPLVTVKVTASRSRQPVGDNTSGSGNVLIGYGTSETTQRRRRRVPAVARAAQEPGSRPGGAVRVISPLVRRLAAENGIDLSQVSPSAPGGIITKRDIEAVLSTDRQEQAVAVVTPVASIAPQTPTALPGETTWTTDKAYPAEPIPDRDLLDELEQDAAAPESGLVAASDTTSETVDVPVPVTAPEPAAALEPAAVSASAAVPGQDALTAARTFGHDDVRLPLTGIRKVIADRLSTSRRDIPDATTWVDVDATGLRSLKDDLATYVPHARIGYLALLARIVVAGLTRFPELNARVDTHAQEIVQMGSVHLSIAAQGPRGLVVPVLHHAEVLSTQELAAALRTLVDRAKAGVLTPEEMSGGTFTLNNYGVYGVDGSTPIINHPEAGMLGVGRIIDRPWVVDGQLCVRPMTQLSLTFDHRVCDGGVAGGFLRYVADCVEHPGALLAGL